jgi:hypothetical protein
VRPQAEWFRRNGRRVTRILCMIRDLPNLGFASVCRHRIPKPITIRLKLSSCDWNFGYPCRRLRAYQFVIDEESCSGNVQNTEFNMIFGKKIFSTRIKKENYNGEHMNATLHPLCDDIDAVRYFQLRRLKSEILQNGTYILDCPETTLS